MGVDRARIGNSLVWRVRFAGSFERSEFCHHAKLSDLFWRNHFFDGGIQEAQLAEERNNVHFLRKELSCVVEADVFRAAAKVFEIEATPGQAPLQALLNCTLSA